MLDLGIAGGLAGTGLALFKVPGGVALAIGGVLLGPDIASKAGVC